ISDLITVHGLINLDFADVRAIMCEMGMAMMGAAVAQGENRAVEAAQKAISSPLLEDVSIEGAQGVLINITGGPDLGLHEVNEAATLIQEEADDDANIIFGAVIDESMGDEMRITVIATGFGERIERSTARGSEARGVHAAGRPVRRHGLVSDDELDVPTWQRRRKDERRLTRLAAERRLFVPGPSGGLSVCLVYPNTYPVAMANLGFQAVFRILSEDPRVACDRAFLPDGDAAGWPRTLRSFEQERPVGDFDVVAFSISFETDYLNVLQCLRLAGIPWRSRQRGARAPLVVAGGPATFLNPEPLAEFVVLFLIGEAEEMLGEFVDRVLARPRGREAVLERAEEVAGAYRPERHHPVYDER